MKIIISNFRDHWFSPYRILEPFEKVFKGYDAYLNDPPKFLQMFCEGLQKFLDTVHPRVEYVKIDKYDTWNADHTLAMVILPVLKQIKETKRGAPIVSDEDVPDEIKSMNAPRTESDWDIDEFYFKRFDYVLDEMIWSFEELLDRDNDIDYERINNGLRLFGKYFRGLWD
jgi:hypothetical protein